MTNTTKGVDDLRGQVCDAVFPPSENSAVGRLEYRGGVGVHKTGDFMVTGNFEPAIDRLTQLFTKQLEEAEIRARIDGAIMGAKFGNAAFRQYNIANSGKPINLDTTRQMGIEQATEWAKRHVE